MRSMLRLLQGIALAAACFTLFGGCAHRPPLDQRTQIPVDRLWLGDQLQQHQVVYGELANNQKIPPDGTIEMVYKTNYTRSAGASRAGASRASAYLGDDPCASFRNVLKCFVGYFAPVIILPVAILALPFIAASELSKSPDAKAAARTGKPEEKAQTQKPVDTESGANLATETTGGGSAQPAISVSALPKEKETISSREKPANWLASMVMERQFSSAWDEAYISAFSQALGWKVSPVKGLVEQHTPQLDGKPTSAPADRHLRAGISQIALLDSNLGEQTLVLCARSLIQWGEATARYFETCQSGSIGLEMPHGSPESSEALRAVLVERARRLAALQAKALTEQTKFVQVAW